MLLSQVSPSECFLCSMQSYMLDKAELMSHYLGPVQVKDDSFNDKYEVLIIILILWE